MARRKEEHVTVRRAGLAVAALACMVVVGAGCFDRTGTSDDREREHPMMKAGQEKERAGDVTGAIQSYKMLTVQAPDMARPHLALAFLLDKPDRDPAAAVYHYQRYLELRPGTEKGDMIASRVRLAKIQMISTVFPSVSNLSERLVIVEQENDQLRTRITNLTTQLAYQKAIVDRLRAADAAREAAERAAIERLAPPAALMQPPVRTIRVERGDTLIKIAARAYGDSTRWRDILEANRNVLRSKDDVRQGQVLVIP